MKNKWSCLKKIENEKRVRIDFKRNGIEKL
jgi:hypothetical protein